MTPSAIVSRLAAVAPKAVRARRRTPAPVRWAVRLKNDPPFDAERWRYGFLVDTIFTRDTWMHRLDISRATALTLTGTAGGQWRSGEAGEHLQLDALDFCWIVAARQPGTGLMATKVPF